MTGIAQNFAKVRVESALAEGVREAVDAEGQVHDHHVPQDRHLQGVVERLVPEQHRDHCRNHQHRQEHRPEEMPANRTGFKPKLCTE